MTRVRVLVLVLVLVGAGLFGVRMWRDAHRSDFSEAVAMLPAGTLRASWTDWAGIRTALDATDLATEVPDSDRISSFIEKAFTSDLSAPSSIDDSAAALALHYGFSPANATWEMFGQSRAGAVMLLKLPSSVDPRSIEDNLESLGYVRPGSDDGVWEGGEDLVATIDPTITPELQYVSVLADRHLVVTSDRGAYLETAVQAVQGKGDLGGSDLAVQVDDPLAATLFVGDFACEALAMSQADPEQQAAASRMIEDAGGVNPLTGLVVAAYDDRRLRVAMAFENDDQAKHNATSRVALASGPAPGQGEDFPDLFSITSASRSGSTVRLDLHASEGSYSLSNLISGPVLFESC